jgi:hypothetical protein
VTEGGATIVRYVAPPSREARAKEERLAWLKGAATPPALFLKLSNIAMANILDVMEPAADDGAMVMRPMSQITERGIDALKVVERTDKVLKHGDGDEQILERKYKITFHDPQAAIRAIVEHYGEAALEFARGGDAGDAEGTVAARGIRVNLAARERTFTTADRQSDFQEKSAAEWERELIGD